MKLKRDDNDDEKTLQYFRSHMGQLAPSRGGKMTSFSP